MAKVEYAQPYDTSSSKTGSPECVSNLSDEDRALAATLVNELGQAHIFAAWAAAGVDDEKKRAFFVQCRQLDNSYPGGMAAYVLSARKLLGESQRGENPLDGWTPSVPDDGVDIAPAAIAARRVGCRRPRSHCCLDGPG